ncbi:hypothetical protein LJK87_19310 [Paenibacillus sp. P25]|nr:hypothetical protein LJK87_19310 [Paenibacillus sp. P25]
MHKALLVFTLLIAGNLAAVPSITGDLSSVVSSPVAHADNYSLVTAHRGAPGPPRRTRSAPCAKPWKTVQDTANSTYRKPPTAWWC